MPEQLPPQELDEEAAEFIEDETDDMTERGLAILRNRKRLALLIAALTLLIVAIYYFVPKLAGIQDAIGRLADAKWYWVAVAVAFNAGSFAAYAVLFRTVVGGKHGDPIRERIGFDASWQIVLAGLAATVLFSAAGAGGVALTYWAVRKAGMERRRVACRIVAWLCLTYLVYLSSLVIFGVLLRTGVLPGSAPVSVTIIPAALAGVALLVIALITLVPGDIERRVGRLSSRPRLARTAGALAKVPATVATGVRTAIDAVRDRRRTAPAVLGAIGFWACNIGVLWSCFQAFDVDCPFGVLVMGFFVGTLANVLPSPAGGVGTVDAGLIGTFILFGIDKDDVFPVILAYRLVFYWLPIPPGIYAFLRLRKTVHSWEGLPEIEGYTSESKVKAEAT